MQNLNTSHSDRSELSLDVELLEERIAPGCIPCGPFALGEGAADTAEGGVDTGNQDAGTGTEENNTYAGPGRRTEHDSTIDIIF